MKISACYIVKNEAKNIAKSIASISNQVDEIIVVDTGSSDDTLAILAQLEVSVYAMPWEEDFSAARNFALSKATGEWLILLDADEYFTDDTKENLRQLIMMSASYNGCMIPMVNLDATTNQELDSFYQLRAVRNLSGLAYHGRVHEELLVNGEVLSSLVQVGADVLKIYHTGYSGHISAVKARRNLTLLEQDIANGRSEADLYPYLCECYAGIGNEEKALHYAWLDVQQGRRNNNYASKCHRKLLTALADKHSRKAVNQRLSVVKLAVEQFPELPDFYAELGEAFAATYQYGVAIKAMEQAVEILPTYQGLEPCLLSTDVLPKLQARIHQWQSILKEKIRISACLIAKDEAVKLPVWLENVSVFADEIIVVDTGSRDETVSLAMKAGAKVITAPWEGNFAKVRNIALEKAIGEWIVFTDADEYFYQPEMLRGYLQQLTQNNPDREAVFLPLDNVDLDAAGKVIDSTQVVRIFRRQQLSYIGRIHEQLSKNGLDDQGIQYAVAPDSLRIKHTGYSANMITDKLQRNLLLINAAVQDGDDIQRYYYYLAQIHFGLSEYDKAIENAVKALKSPYQPVVQDDKMYRIIYDALDYVLYPVQDKNIIRGLQELFDKTTEKQAVKQGITPMLKKLAENLQYLFVACLNSTTDKQGEIYLKYINLLPAGVQQVIKAFHAADTDVVCSYSFDSYVAFFEAVCKYSTEEVLLRYVDLCKAFPDEQIYQIADRLLAQEKWLLALGLYGELSADSSYVTDKFWFSCGKCFYYLQEYASAFECFNKASNLINKADERYGNELTSYLAWCQEKV